MHKTVKFNYTTYDVRRNQDVINPTKSSNNIMMLAKSDLADASNRHPFLYGRVLGVFHVNVVCHGPGISDNEPRRFDVLWVRRYDLEVEEDTTRGVRRSARSGPRPVEKTKQSLNLDRLSFRSWDTEDAIGFVDPAQVIRGCHIIPAFAAGKRSPDGTGTSKCARDSDDWNAYYISRWVFI